LPLLLAVGGLGRPGAAAAGRFKGEGYSFDLPTRKGQAYQAVTHQGEDSQEVLLVPPALSPRRAAEAGLEDFGRLGVVRLEASPSDEEDPKTLEALRQETVQSLKEEGAKYRLEALAKGPLPGFKAEVAAPVPFSLWVVLGRRAVYTLTAGPSSGEALAVIRSLKEDPPVHRLAGPGVRGSAGAAAGTAGARRRPPVDWIHPAPHPADEVKLEYEQPGYDGPDLETVLSELGLR